MTYRFFETLKGQTRKVRDAANRLATGIGSVPDLLAAALAAYQVDALLEAFGQLPCVPMPNKQTCEWRALIAYRQTLVGKRVAAQNRIRSIFVGQRMAAPLKYRRFATHQVCEVPLEKNVKKTGNNQRARS